MSTGLFSATQVASSGLAAERLHMEVAAANIANAESTRSENGGPYRRQEVVFSASLNGALRRAAEGQLGGVESVEILEDQSEMPRVYAPGHPDADADGFVTYPNVQIAHELVDLMTAARAYEANLKSLQMFKSMTEQSLALLRGS
jgi:flagellar basal-body rod protein FlgC